ncbi:MAG: nucleotidyltransferase domain-containing protein [Rectinema subterraneum]|jgi:predicted nucleotidyltransferase|uniref:nucleotidyltransferase domain-containing protein n=1 Tax=Rectinema subterraneum TaxID=2653714 RepID=UPI003C7EB594
MKQERLKKSTLAPFSKSLKAEKIVHTIRGYKEPVRIVLFGSRAVGKEQKDSDIDICVIYKNLPKRNLEVLQDLYRELFKLDTEPVDLLVFDEKCFNEKAAHPNSLEAKILRDGVLLYG